VLTVSESSDDFGIPIHEFEKGPRKRIRLHLQEYRGARFLDVREFYLDKSTNEWRPSPKGVTIQPHLVPELLAGVLSAVESLGLDLSEELDATG
jgi:hypothetical protein